MRRQGRALRPLPLSPLSRAAADNSLAHLLPCISCDLMMTASSQLLNGSFLTSGLSWLHHRRRQLFPERPLMLLAISDQFLGPGWWMRVRSRSSSCGARTQQRGR